MTGPEPHTQVTAELIYRELVDLKADVKVMRHELTQIADHESRLRELEKARWPLPTLAILIALAAAIFAGINVAS